MSQRQNLRQQMRTRRAQLTVIEQQTATQKLYQLLVQQKIFQQSLHVAAYISVKGEIDTTAIIKNIWQRKKICYLPIVDHQTKTLSFANYQTEDKLINNDYQIPEPIFTYENGADIKTLDLVLMPLVAFDLQGNRLGMGAGYYDKTFAFLNNLQRPAKPFLLGLAYDWQRAAIIEPETWDVKLDAVVTDKKFYIFT